MGSNKNKSAAKTVRGAFRTIGIVFALVGLLVMGIFIFLVYNESRYDDQYDKVEAQIVEITSHRDTDGDTSHSVFVSYDYNGRFYERVSLNSYTSSMREGKFVTVYIDPSEPTYLRYKMGIGFYLGFIAFGLIFGGVGAGLLITSGGNAQRRLVDKGQGEPVYATVISTAKTATRVNNMTTYRVIAQWTDQYGITHDFKSELLYFDPAIYIKEGELIRVYVDPNNYKKYYVCAQELQSEDPDYQQYSEY